MNYQNQTAAADVPSTLLSESARLLDALRDVHSRVIKIGDVLFGSEPREIGKPSAPEPIPSVTRNIDNSHRAISDIHEVLRRLENRC